jgi:5'-nucleotidase
MSNRRNFIKTTTAGAMALGLPSLAWADEGKELLTILHTNDVHSQIEPFPDNHSRYPGMGGAAARAAIINEIRKKEKHVLLLDAGDIFQGTPYLNIYKGEVEMKLMSRLGYDAATMGNHDFDLGVAGFEKQLVHTNFPIVCSNYDFSQTVLHGKTHPFHVIKKGKLRIGILGLGIDLKGLVFGDIHQQVKYLDPIITANDIAAILRHQHKCHLVICLSHLGYQYGDNKVSDRIVAAKTSNINIIIGGHTHTFMEKPEPVDNLDGEPVWINQVGWAGLYLGRIDVSFERNMKKKTVFGRPVVVDKKSIGV